MSRFVGSGFIAFDLTASIMSLLSCSGTALILLTSILTSLAIATMSVTVKSILWPAYFWDQSC